MLLWGSNLWKNPEIAWSNSTLKVSSWEEDYLSIYKGYLCHILKQCETLTSSVIIFAHTTSQWPNFFGYKEVWVGYENKTPLTRTPLTHAYSCIPSPIFAVPTRLNRKCSNLWWRKLQAEKRAKQCRNKKCSKLWWKKRNKLEDGGEGRRWWRRGEWAARRQLRMKDGSLTFCLKWWSTKEWGMRFLFSSDER